MNYPLYAKRNVGVLGVGDGGKSNKPRNKTSLISRIEKIKKNSVRFVFILLNLVLDYFHYCITVAIVL